MVSSETLPSLVLVPRMLLLGAAPLALPGGRRLRRVVVPGVELGDHVDEGDVEEDARRGAEDPRGEVIGGA